MPINPQWLLAGMDRVWEPVATPVGLFLAVLVTGHILLTKRDVAACIGWIGLAWIAPTWGALLYYMLGINRVVRRAQRARRRRPPRERVTGVAIDEIDPHLKSFERAVGRITGRRSDKGNAVAVFRHGDQGYPAMLAAINGAKHCVALSTYIMQNGQIGSQFVEALTAASRRGVEVRVLIDGIGSGYFPPIYRQLRRNGVPAALFMHSALPWRMPFLNLRSHKKLLLVDGRAGFAGGMNISDANLVAAKPRHPVADTHFLFEGPVVTQLTDAFAQDWFFTTGEELDSAAWFPELSPAGPATARVISSGPDQDLEKIHSVLLEAIACATASIKIMTPYFLPSEDLLTALALAAVRGVEVDIIVPTRSDHRFVDLAMRAHVGPLLSRGVRLWLGQPPFDHSKLMVVDSEWCLVGSANWDMRSLRLNFELDVEIYSAELAAEIDAVMRPRQQTLLRLRDLTGRSLPIRLRDAALRLLLPYI